MQDLSYESFKQGKFKAKKTNLDLSYSTFLVNKEKTKSIELEREQLREQGLPVGTTSRKAGPTTAGSIVRSVLKPLADIATNIGNIKTAAEGKEWQTPYSGDYLGKVEGLGKVDMTNSPLAPENLKTIKKSVGTGLELSSYLGYGGAGASAVKAGISKLTETAAKQTFREYFVSQFPNLLKEGALTGAAYTAGSQMREDKDFSWKQALTDIGISTALTPLAALGLRKVFGTSANKIIKAREVERLAKDAEILGKSIPEVGIPSAEFMTKEGRVLPERATPEAITLPEKGILEGQQKLREGLSTVEEVEPLTLKSKSAKKIKTSTQEPAIEQKIPKIIKTTEPNFTKEEVEDAYNTATRNFKPDEWDATTLNEQLGRFKELQQTDPDKLMRLAMSSKEGDTLKNNWALSFLENEAKRTGNIELSKQLSYSNVGSKAGQELVGGRFKDKDTLASIMRDVRKSRAKTQGVSDKAIEKEEQDLLKKLNENIKSYREGKITKGEIDDIIRDITCKE